MASPLNIMVTNDDGIDSVGLHVLARAMLPFGKVTVIAPDREFSGAGAAIGAIWEDMPEVHRASIEGIETAWTVGGPPALCALFARLGAFGDIPDLIVSGINPGANVGRSVYHSGTIGAALTGRNGGIPGIAVSQSVKGTGVEGQAWGDVIAQINWDTGAAVAAACVEGFIANPMEEIGVLNINVPAGELSDIEGFEWTQIGTTPPMAMSKINLIPKPNHTDTFIVEMEYGAATDQPRNTDTLAMVDNKVSLTWLSRITALDIPSAGIDESLNKLL